MQQRLQQRRSPLSGEKLGADRDWRSELALAALALFVLGSALLGVSS